MTREIVTRGGVRGHEIEVAPKKGYKRFVPLKYDKDDPAPRRRPRGSRR